MSIDTTNIPEQIIALKRRIHEQRPNITEHFRELETILAEEIDSIESASKRGESIIPEIAFSDIVASQVDETTIKAVKSRGAVVVRGVFTKKKASWWYEELERYLETNGYFEQDDPELDHYFSDLKADRPQICAVYWSKPQVEARQSPNLAQTRSFLNRLWNYQGNGTQHFDPDRECSYAGRVRMRLPGDTSLGLSPQVNGGSVERWLGDNYQQVYESRSVFECS